MIVTRAYPNRAPGRWRHKPLCQDPDGPARIRTHTGCLVYS